MKLMAILTVFAAGLTTTPAWALSCAMPTVESAVQHSAAVVMGAATATDFVANNTPNSLSRGVQKVTLRVEHIKSDAFFVPKEGLLHFDAHVTAFDVPFFKEGEHYVVFLEDNDGTLTYPVCGMHYVLGKEKEHDQKLLKKLGWN